MSNYNSSHFAFMLASGYNLRPYMTGGVTINDAATTVDNTALGDSAVSKLYGGERTTDLSFDVTYDDAPGAERDFLQNGTTGKFAGVAQIAYGVEGNTLGKSFVGLAGMNVEGQTRTPKKGDIHRGSITFSNASAYGHEDGAILLPLAVLTGATDSSGVDSGAAPAVATITAISIASAAVVQTNAAHGFLVGQTVLIAGTNSTPVIDGLQVITAVSDTTHFTIAVATSGSGSTGTATYANGGAVHLQVPACALGGYTDWKVQLQDFTADTPASYANVAGAAAQTITAATIPTAYRIPVTGVIRRWTRLRVTLDGAGNSPSITLMGGLARL